MATHLAKALHGVGYTISQIWSRSFDHAEQFAYEVSAHPIDKLERLNTTDSYYILAINDDALFEVAPQLSLRDAVVVHTSGSVPMSVLRTISRHHGVLYAPQTFVRTQQMDYAQLPFCIEGATPQALKEIELLARSISEKVFPVDSDQRVWLHMASVMMNNFGNALHAMGQDLMREHNLPFEILQPLIELTTKKALSEYASTDSLWRLQTGPAVRGDEKTIYKHLSMLKDNETLFHLYELMTKAIEENCPPTTQKK